MQKFENRTHLNLDEIIICLLVQRVNVNTPVYKQKIWTHGKGVMAPMKNEIMSVMEVIVMLTAASAKV